MDLYAHETNKLKRRTAVMLLVDRREKLKRKMQRLRETSTSQQLEVAEDDLSEIYAEMMSLNLELKEKIPQYEAAFRERFSIDGKSYLKVVDAEHITWSSEGHC